MMRSILEKTNSRKKRNLRNTITDSLKTRECYFERKKNVQMFVLLLFSCSVMSDSVTSRTAARQASLSITNSWSLLKLMSIESVMPSNHLILCCLLILLPSVFPNIRVFSIESVLRIRWPKYWSFSFTISPSNEYSGPISFRINWLDLLNVQGILKTLPTPQFKTINSSVLSFFYGPALPSIQDYWKNHGFD